MLRLSGLLALCVLPLALSKVNETGYDYVIVGSGPAGIMLADRLSEAGKQVLLIERGGPSTAATGGTDTPPWPYSTNLTRFDIPGAFESFYNLTTGVPYWWCRDLPTQGPGACIVGGGTAINSMLYWYPTDDDFATTNNWPPGWQNIAPYISKLQSRLPSTDNPSADGKRYLTQVYDVFKGVLDAQRYKSITINDQRNKKDKVYGYSAFYSQKGIRTGPMGSYLQTALARPNFKLLMYTMVQAVARNGSHITGVYTDNTDVGTNGFIPIKSKGGRVILSAGAFGSARLLFQSGIGPTDILPIIESTPSSAPYLPPKSSYITLPVGYNTQDNPSIPLIFTHPSINTYQNYAPVWFTPNLTDAKLYVDKQSGVLAQMGPRINWWRKYVGGDGGERWVQGTANPAGCCVSGLGGSNETLFQVTLYLGRGLKSVGRAGISNSTRMRLITAPWLTDPVDKDVLVQATMDVLSTYKQVPSLELLYPNLNTTTIEAHILSTVGGSNHWAGTTRTGINSTISVVDPNLKVWGTDNLFVADSGVFPGMPVGNPTASIMIMAEMAAVKLLRLL